MLQLKSIQLCHVPCRRSHISRFSLFKKEAQITFYSPYGKKRDSADQQIKMTYDYMTIARTWVATRKVLGIAFAFPYYNWFPYPTQEPNHQPKAAAGGGHPLPAPPRPPVGLVAGVALALLGG